MAYVRQARLEDAFELSLNLRQADLDELVVSSNDHPLVILSRPFTKPNFYQTYSTIHDDGTVMSMFGVSEDGVIWMLSSDSLFKKHTKRFIKECRFWIDVLQADHTMIYNWVDHRNTKSIRWLKYCGFSISPQTQPFGPFNHQFYLLYRHKEGTNNVHEFSESATTPAPASPTAS